MMMMHGGERRREAGGGGNESSDEAELAVEKMQQDSSKPSWKKLFGVLRNEWWLTDSGNGRDVIRDGSSSGASAYGAFFIRPDNW